MQVVIGVGAKVYCSKCERDTNHVYIHQHELKNKVYDEFSWMEKFSIIKCNGCDSIGFLREYGDEDMIKPSPNSDGEYEYYTELTVYPDRKLIDEPDVLIQEEQFTRVPEQIGILYTQVVSAINSKHYLLSGAGIRMIIEGICNDKSIKDGLVAGSSGSTKRMSNLEGKINGLEESRFITPTEAKILHEVRKIGNETVHQLNHPTIKSLRKIMQVITKLLFSIYEIEDLDVR